MLCLLGPLALGPRLRLRCCRGKAAGRLFCCRGEAVGRLRRLRRPRRHGPLRRRRSSHGGLRLWRKPSPRSSRGGRILCTLAADSKVGVRSAVAPGKARHPAGSGHSGG